MKTIREAIRNPLLCLPEAQIPVRSRGRPALEAACGLRGGGVRGRQCTGDPAEESGRRAVG
jgi:hypothetical protein